MANDYTRLGNHELRELGEEAFQRGDEDLLRTIVAVVDRRRSQLAADVHERLVLLLDQLHEGGGEPVGEVLFDHYGIEEPIPGGGMADAFRVVDLRSETTRFLKCVRRSDKRLSAPFGRELRVLEKVSLAEPKHVTVLIEFCRDEERDGLVTEWADGGNLDRYFNPQEGLPTDEAVGIARHVLTGLAELHAVDVVHRDLKPANVVRMGDTWKLIDFGIAKDTSRVLTAKTFRGWGTPGFKAPEQQKHAEGTPAMDIYAFGKLLSLLLTGEKDPDVAFDQVPGLGGLAYDCTERDPLARPSLQEVMRRLG